MSEDMGVQDGDPMDRFVVKYKLGEGSYGCVYYGIDRVDGSECAIKVLEVDDDNLDDQEREIAIQNRCKCEYIVGFKGCWFKDNNLWIVMEFCVGGSVGDLQCVRDAVIDTELHVIAIVKMTLLGLLYLHTDHKMHRDVKAANILIARDGTCKLADFGVAAELTQTMARRQTKIGTPYWMAPEVIKESYDIRGDIWSVGITILEIIHGCPPLHDMHPMKAQFAIQNRPAPTLEHPEKFSAGFNSFMSLLLQKDPEHRASCKELLNHSIMQSVSEAKCKEIVRDLLTPWLDVIEQQRIEEGVDNENITAPNDDDHTINNGNNNNNNNNNNKNLNTFNGFTQSFIDAPQDNDEYNNGTMVFNNNIHDNTCVSPTASGWSYQDTSRVSSSQQSVQTGYHGNNANNNTTVMRNLPVYDSDTVVVMEEDIVAPSLDLGYMHNCDTTVIHGKIEEIMPELNVTTSIEHKQPPPLPAAILSPNVTVRRKLENENQSNNMNITINESPSNQNSNNQNNVVTPTTSTTPNSNIDGLKKKFEPSYSVHSMSSTTSSTIISGKVDSTLPAKLHVQGHTAAELANTSVGSIGDRISDLERRKKEDMLILEQYYAAAKKLVLQS